MVPMQFHNHKGQGTPGGQRHLSLQQYIKIISAKFQTGPPESSSSERYLCNLLKLQKKLFIPNKHFSC
jgi:hypothetical protein